MRRILGVFMALFMFCVPMGIQADEEVLSFEYTGQKIEIKKATVILVDFKINTFF